MTRTSEHHPKKTLPPPLRRRRRHLISHVTDWVHSFFFLFSGDDLLWKIRGRNWVLNGRKETMSGRERRWLGGGGGRVSQWIFLACRRERGRSYRHLYPSLRHSPPLFCPPLFDGGGDNIGAVVAFYSSLLLSILPPQCVNFFLFVRAGESVPIKKPSFFRTVYI